MSSQLLDLQTELMGATDFGDFLNLKKKLQDFKSLRSQLLTPDKEIDILLKESLHAIDQKIQEYQEDHKEQLTQDIEKNLELITEYMNTIDYMPQITSIYSSDLRKQTESMLGYIDNESAKQYKKQMSDIVNKRQSHLTKQLKDAEKSNQQQQEETILEIKNNLTSIV